MLDNRHRSVEVRVPDTTDTIVMNVVGFGLAGLLLLSWLARRYPGELVPTRFVIDAPTIIWFLALVALGLVAHEAVHGVMVRLFGGRPRFGAGELKGVPYLFTTAPGHLFSKAQYLAIVLAPLLVITLPMVAMAFWGSNPGRWLMPALVWVGAGVGDLWLAWRALRAPSGARIEDLRDGLAIHRIGASRG